MHAAKMRAAVPVPQARTRGWEGNRKVRARAGAAQAGTGSERRPGANKGFVEEMRFVAMRLHTKEQAPKEGQKEARKDEEKPVAQWTPTRQGYLNFLAESKKVYDCMETIMDDAPVAEYAKFKNTGLERGSALAEDIEWFRNTYDMVPSSIEASPGDEYVSLLESLSKKDPPAFICHYYNVYFAHTAGGLMIGRKMSESLLDGTTLKFYQWDGDVKEELLPRVRDTLNEVAEGWTREQKDRCLEETQKSFQYSGSLLRLIAT